MNMHHYMFKSKIRIFQERFIFKEGSTSSNFEQSNDYSVGKYINFDEKKLFEFTTLPFDFDKREIHKFNEFTHMYKHPNKTQNQIEEFFLNNKNKVNNFEKTKENINSPLFNSLLKIFTNKERSLQYIQNKCLDFDDCFNCTSYSDKYVDCIWFKGGCINNTSPRIKNWWNYFDTCISDYNSLNLMTKYCGNLEYDTLPLSITMNKINNIYGTPYLFCSWTINFNDPFKLVTVNYTDNIVDSDSTVVLQVTYLDGAAINKTLPSRLEWILQGIISLKFFFFTRRSFSIIPFKIDISNESNTSNNYLGLFVSLGVVVFVCLICSVCFYKCSRIIIENANRRLEQRRRINNNLINLNLIPNEEDNIRKTNQEVLNKLLETDLKPLKYNEKINHFQTNCTICLEEFNNSTEVIFLFCKHIFHFNCLKDWLDKNILLPKCPNCNYNILTGGVIDLNNNNQNNQENMNLNTNNINVIYVNNNNLNNIAHPQMNFAENNIINIACANANLNGNCNLNVIDNNEPNELNENQDGMNLVKNSTISKKNSKNEYMRIDIINDMSYGKENKNEELKNEMNNVKFSSNNSENALKTENYDSQGNNFNNSLNENFNNINFYDHELSNNQFDSKLRITNFVKKFSNPPPNRPFSNRQHNNFMDKFDNNNKNYDFDKDKDFVRGEIIKK